MSRGQLDVLQIVTHIEEQSFPLFLDLLFGRVFLYIRMILK